MVDRWDHGVPEKKWQGTTGRKISFGYAKEFGPYPIVSEEILMLFKERSNMYGSTITE